MKVSIIMPVYNEENIVKQSIFSALSQDYRDKEIVVIDDNSRDRTYQACESFPVKLYKNKRNLGLAKNLNECISKSIGEIIVILCGDDVFTHQSVVSDMVKLFENPKVGVVGRYYYQYLDGYQGAVMTIRGDIFTSSCQPSGIGFRRKALKGWFSDKMFIEVPSMIKNVLEDWEYRIIKYDTIAARLHKSNAAICPNYYKRYLSQSPTLNWHKILGKPIGMFLGLIQIKNRVPQLLFREILVTIKLNPKVLFNLGFWICALTAVIVPRWILIPLSQFYRHRITRRFCEIIRRPDENLKYRLRRG